LINAFRGYTMHVNDTDVWLSQSVKCLVSNKFSHDSYTCLRQCLIPRKC